MEHFRFVLMTILAAPIAAPVNPIGNSEMLQLMTLGATFISQVKVNGFSAWIIEELKQSKNPALAWISTNTPWMTRAVAAIAASLTAIGIHWTFTGSTFAISGLSLAAIVTAIYNIAQNFLFQHVFWKVAFAAPRPIQVSKG